jgi:hypothetical protein
MDNMKKGAQEAKQLNQRIKNGSMSSFTSSTEFNSPELQEARQLNSQAGGVGSSLSSSVPTESSFSNNSLEETKKLNQQSKQNKSK